MLRSTNQKTTVEVSDDLYRRAKSEAALRGRKLKDLVEEGLRLVLETPRTTPGRRSLAGLMKSGTRGGELWIADLASNPEHLKGFGQRCAPRSLTPGHWSLFSTGRNRHHRWVAEQLEELDLAAARL